MRPFIISFVALLILVVSVAAAPIITIHSPQQNQVLNTSTVFINVSSNSTANFTYTIDAAAFDVLGTNTTLASTSINTSEGLHTLTVKAKDSTGNTTTSVSFFVDSTLPLVTLNFPENNSNFQTQQANFIFTASDNLASSLACSFSIDGKEKQTKVLVNPQKAEFAEIVSEGNHNWSISCKDQAGNTRTQSRIFSVDSICGINTYNIGVQNNLITFFVKNTGTKDYFAEYTVKVNLDQIVKDFVQVKVGESKLVQRNFQFEDNKDYLIESFVKSDCGMEDSLSVQYKKVGPVCTNPDGFTSEIKCDAANRRMIQCLTGGQWSEYSKEQYLYCNSCSHCGDGLINCGETESTCQQDYRLQASCDCLNKRQVVGSTVITGSNFYNSCRGVCNLDCSSDFECPSGFCSDFKCGIRPGSCQLSLDDLEYNLQAGVNSTSYILAKAKNIGQIPTNVTLTLKVDGNQYNQSTFPLAALEEALKTFYYSLTQVGNHKVSLDTSASCGFSQTKEVDVEVVNKTITSINLDVPAVTIVDLDPLSITANQGSDSTFKISIKTTRPQTFVLNISGVPESWLSYPSIIGTGRERDVYVHLLARNSGEYNLSISVLGETQEFKFNPQVVVIEPETIGERELILALSVIAVLFIAVLYFAFKRFEHEEFEYD